MKLRLALAVSTCIEPEILLMDEWIGLGDAAFVEKAGRRLDEFVNRAGILVLASHNPRCSNATALREYSSMPGGSKRPGPIGEVLREYGEVGR